MADRYLDLLEEHINGLGDEIEAEQITLAGKGDVLLIFQSGRPTIMVERSEAMEVWDDITSQSG